MHKWCVNHKAFIWSIGGAFTLFLFFLMCSFSNPAPFLVSFVFLMPLVVFLQELTDPEGIESSEENWFRKVLSSRES